MQSSPEINSSIRLQVKNELTNLIYPSLYSTVPLLAAVATILVFKLSGHVNREYLLDWLGAFLVVTLAQGALAIWHAKTKDSLKWDHLYYKLLIADVGIIGLLWGAAAVLLMPDDTIGQSFLIYTLTFVAGGGAIYLSRSYLAGTVFATGILIPLVASLVSSFFSQVHHEIYFNLTLGVACLWSYITVVNYYNSKLFAENFAHKLINKTLSEDLSQANEQLAKVNLVARTEKEEQVSQLIHYCSDSLTDADTNEILAIKFIQSRAYARRHHQSLGVMLININNYEEVKNSLGNDIGNLLIKTAAIRLQYCRRETDILARFKENQFILVISEISLGNEIPIVLSKIERIFAEKTIIDDGKVFIKASVGISIFHKDGDELEELVKKSQSALSQIPADKNVDIFNSQIYDPNTTTTDIKNSTVVDDDSNEV